MNKTMAILLALSFLTPTLWASEKVALSPGEVVFKRIANRILQAKQLGFNVAADIRGTGPNKSREPMSVKIDVALDSRNVNHEKKRIAVDTQMAGKPIKLFLNTDKDDVYFAANFPGQPPMAYHLNTKAQAPGTPPSGMMGQDGSVMNIKGIHGFGKGQEPHARPGATPPKSMDSRFIDKRAMDFGNMGDSSGGGNPFGGGGANPMADILGQIKAQVKTRKGEAPDAAALEGVKKKANIIFIKPNILKFVPKDAKEGTAKLYFDPKSDLPQTLAISDPEKGMMANVRFSNWKFNKSVNTKLAMPRMQYQEFTADAFGKLFGAFAAFSGGAGGPTMPPTGPSGGPKWMPVTKPDASGSDGPAANPFGGGNPFGGTNPFGGKNPFVGGANPFGGGAKPSGKPVDMKDAQRSLSQGMKGLSEMMKKLSDPKFQKSMQGFSSSMQKLGNSMQGGAAPKQPKMPAFPPNFGKSPKSQADYDKQMKAAEKSMQEAQQKFQQMMQKFNSPEFKKMMKQTEEATKQLQNQLKDFAPAQPTGKK